MFDRMEGNEIEGVSNDEFYIDSSTGDHRIRVRVFKPLNAPEKLPAMLYIHGGGYMMGSPEQALPFYEELLERRDLAIIAPAYRLSLDHPFPAGFNDAYDTLLWMHENADQVGIYPDNFIIAGHSAGGGMTAAVTLKVRDTQDVQIAFQMPIYPMIDYRQSTESAVNMNGALFWDTRSNAFGWERYLRDLEGDEVPTYASPALNEDYTGFPPTISYVGTVEPFFDETVAYMKALDAAGIPTRFEIFEGAYHGFEAYAPDTAIGQAGMQFQYSAFEEFFDLYVGQ
jgi:acetyl esterase/lipase